VGILGIPGCLPWQKSNLYVDPQGRFTFEIDPSWEQVQTDGSYAQFKVPDPPVTLYMLAFEAGTVEAAFLQAMEVAGFDPELLHGDAVTTSATAPARKGRCSSIPTWAWAWWS